MKTNSGNTQNNSSLQQFAVRKERKEVQIGDRAITYNRCSSEKQDSVEWQSKVTAGFVKQSNWQLIKPFGAKESAKTDDRKEFQQMLQFCKKENISHIVFYSYDRFSRAGNLSLIDELRVKGIKVHSATQNVDDDTAGGRMMQKFYLVIAQMENEQRRDKVIEGQKNKLRKGEWVSTPPIGYEKRYISGKKEHDHDKKQCFINDKGELIRQAFHWKFTEEISNVEIIRRLDTMGLSLKHPKLTRIFRNPFYCGYVSNSLLDDGELIRGKHQALVSEEVFLHVNGIVNSRAHGWNVIRENEHMPLKASVRCGKCNRALTGYAIREKYIYYKCPNKGCCLNITNKELHSLFEEELSKLTVNHQLIPLIKNQMEATYLSLHQRDSIRGKPLKDELTRLKNELDTMEFNLVIGKVNPELYSKHADSHQLKIAEIERELEKLIQDSSNLNFFLNNTLKFAGNLLELWQLHDYTGKVRLQKLVFPDGLLYLPENHAVRTHGINPIFSAITSISSTLSSELSFETSSESQMFHQLYSMFSSSNFFWESLVEIQSQIIGFEHYPQSAESPYVSQFGAYSSSTQNIQFDTPVTDMQAGAKNPKPIFFNRLMSGGTGQIIISQNPNK